MKRRMRFPALLIALALLFSPCASLGEAGAEHLTVLLIGVDSAQDQSPEEAGSADALMIASLDLKTGAARLLSIQKEIEISLPQGRGPLSSANRIGGPKLTLQAVNELLQLDIPYFVQVDMAGFQKIFQAVGGLELTIDEKELSTLMPDGVTRAFSQAGLQAVTPEQAMAYLNDPAAKKDLSRSTRLLNALGALMKKAMNLDGGKLLDVVSELIVYVQSNMTAGDMMQAVLAVAGVKLSDLSKMRFPKASSGENGAAADLDAQINAAREFLLGAGQ